MSYAQAFGMLKSARGWFVALLVGGPFVWWVFGAKAETPSPGIKAGQRVSQLERVVHRVELADPVFPAKSPQVYELVQLKDRNGDPAEYTLSFRTHVCVDNQCKPVEVTLFWNAVGYFERLEYPPAMPLTKKEHVPFTDEDYVKLDRILKDRNSILGSWAVSYLEQPVPAEENVDAVTAPTPVTVQDSVVEDAAFTTWALWRWANGEIVPKLHNITEQSCSPAYLKRLLKSEDRRFADFALDYLVEQDRFDPDFADSVFHLLEHGERDQILRALTYLDKAVANKQTLHARLVDSCCRVRPADCPLILEKLSGEPDLSAGTLEALTGRLDELPYFPIHLVLRMLEERKFASDTTIADAAALLVNDDFFIARRAYEHLSKLDPGGDVQAKIEAFHERNRDRL